MGSVPSFPRAERTRTSGFCWFRGCFRPLDPSSPLKNCGTSMAESDEMRRHWELSLKACRTSLCLLIRLMIVVGRFGLDSAKFCCDAASDADGTGTAADVMARGATDGSPDDGMEEEDGAAVGWEAQ